MQHSLLLAFESKRRTAFEAKLKTCCKQWRSSVFSVGGVNFEELGEPDSCLLTKQILPTNKKECATEDSFADAAKTALKAASNRFMAGLKGQGKIVDFSPEDLPEMTQSDESSQESSQESSVPGSPCSSHLAEQKSPENDFSILAEPWFAENAKQAVCRKQLEVHVSDMGRLCEHIIIQLRLAENQVTQAWDDYDFMASKREGSPLQESTAPRTDPWVFEMRYRVTVFYQAQAWKEATADMAKLYELIHRFVSTLPSSSQTQEQDKIEDSLPNAEVCSVLGNQEDGFEHDFTTWAFPLSSQSVLATEVIETRKRSMGFAGWSTWERALAVVTADSFLHLFVIPSSPAVISGPHEAWHALMPQAFHLPSDAIKKGNTNPSDTLFLPNCKVIGGFMDDECTFEVVEAGEWKFGKPKRRLMLRTGSLEEKEEWIDTLNKMAPLC